MRTVEFTQLDPLRPVARAHDLMLHSRVTGYREGMFEELTYKDRKFFDWGGWLAAMPMEELPYWRVMMQHHAVGRWGKRFAAEHQQVVDHVLKALTERGPLMNRDFESTKAIAGSYRSGKDTGNALYYLWIKGDVMTFDRKRFERVYHLRESVVPPHLAHTADVAEAERAIALKQVAWHGFCKPVSITGEFRYVIDKEKGPELIQNLLDSGLLTWITPDGHPGKRLMLTSDLPIIKTLELGDLPQEWSPLKETTEDEVTFLSPLDVVSARGRAKQLFEFDYIWEVYKPLHLRKWGYYTMPMLYGDRLVGRIEPTLDKKTVALTILGLSLEEPELAKSKAFGNALGKGIQRMAWFADAKSIDLGGIEDDKLRSLAM